jgi:integrase
VPGGARHSDNPIRNLEADEKPAIESRQKRILEEKGNPQADRATREGTPLLQGNVTKRGLDKGAAKLKRVGEPKLRMHDLRHCLASMLIAAGADVVFVARQLGHANPAITLRVYAHLFDSEAQGTRMRDALEARFGGGVHVTPSPNGQPVRAVGR